MYLALLSVVDSATLLSRLDASALAPGFALDAAAVALTVLMLRRVTVAARDGAGISFGALVIATSLMPLFRQRQGGVAGRHLLLPSLGLALLVTANLGSMRRWKTGVVAFCVAALPIAQGQAQAQVGACRLNAALVAALRIRTDEIAGARHVVFDMRSFTEAVPSGWLRLDFDHLNNYFGAQAFADWGLTSMVRLFAQGSRPAVHFAVSTPSRGPETWYFFAGHDTGSRAFRTTRQAVPISETIVVSFADLRLPGALPGGRRGGEPSQGQPRLSDTPRPAEAERTERFFRRADGAGVLATLAGCFVWLFLAGPEFRADAPSYYVYLRSALLDHDQ